MEPALRECRQWCRLVAHRVFGGELPGRIVGRQYCACEGLPVRARLPRVGQGGQWTQSARCLSGLSALALALRQALGDWLSRASADPSHRPVVDVATSTLCLLDRVFSKQDSEIPSLDAESTTLEEPAEPASLLGAGPSLRGRPRANGESLGPARGRWAC